MSGAFLPDCHRVHCPTYVSGLFNAHGVDGVREASCSIGREYSSGHSFVLDSMYIDRTTHSGCLTADLLMTGVADVSNDVCWCGVKTTAADFWCSGLVVSVDCRSCACLGRDSVPSTGTVYASTVEGSHDYEPAVCHITGPDESV